MKFRSQLRYILEGIEGLIIFCSVTFTWPVSKHWLYCWGSTPDEREKVWPGDRFVSPGFDSHTRAIDVNASAGAVWQWVVQFGLDRAGFYSYELLERLGGIPVTNLECIEPAFQSLAVGDNIRLHPKAPGVVVEDLISEKHICTVQYDMDAKAEAIRSWSIYIEPGVEGSCRLVLRSCHRSLHRPSFLRRLGESFEKPLDFVMEQRMLRTVKRLVEIDNI